MKTIITWMLVMCLVPFLTGCGELADCTLTGHVWSKEVVSAHSEPAPFPDLKVYQTSDHKDYLVVYDEQRQNRPVIRRRAYLLKANEKRIEAGGRPHFIQARHLEHLQSVPVETNAVIEASYLEGPNVQLLPDCRHFTLICNGDEIGSFHLPVYVNKGDRVWRIALTPVTVTTDVAIYATVATVVLIVVAAANSNDDTDYSLPNKKHSDKDRDKDKNK